MTKSVILRTKADADIDSALAYYLANAPDDVEALLKAFQHALDTIARAPTMGSPRHAHELDLPGLRCLAITRFPYLVFYMDLAKEIAVIRVLHQRQNILEELMME